MKRIAATVTVFLVLAMAFEAAAQTRVRFARGRTSTTLSGSIGSIGERDFVLSAYAGQWLSATVSSSSGCIKFSTIETAQSYRTDRGDNWLKLMNMCRRTASYTMTVSIR